MRTGYAWLRRQWRRLPEMLRWCLLAVVFFVTPGFLLVAYSTELAMWTYLGVLLVTMFAVLLQKKWHWSLRVLTFIALALLWLAGGAFVGQQTRDRIEGELDVFGHVITPEMRARDAWYENLRQKKEAERQRIIHDVNTDTSLPRNVKINTDAQKIIVNDDLASARITGIYDSYNKYSDLVVRKIDGKWQAGCLVMDLWQPVQTLVADGGQVAAHIAVTGTCPRT